MARLCNMYAVRQDSISFDATRLLMRRHQYAFTDEVNDQTIDGRRNLNDGHASTNVPAGEGFTDVMHCMPLRMYMSVQLGSHSLHKGQC